MTKTALGLDVVDVLKLNWFKCRDSQPHTRSASQRMIGFIGDPNEFRASGYKNAQDHFARIKNL